MCTKIYLLLCFFLVVSACKEKQEPVTTASEIFELAAPQVRVDSLLFKDSARVTAIFDMEGSAIRYTENGSDVTLDSPRYENMLIIKEPKEVSFRVFHPDYRPSNAVTVRVLQVKQDISNATVTLTPPPHPNYNGGGAQVLVDFQKGTTQFRAGKHWLGFQGEQIKILVEFEKKTALSKLVISALKDHGSWIFLPKGIRVFGEVKNEIGLVSVPIPDAVQPKQIALIDVPLVSDSYKSIEIHIDLLETIPQWHQGNGTLPFFFIDEILVE